MTTTEMTGVDAMTFRLNKRNSTPSLDFHFPNFSEERLQRISENSFAFGAKMATTPRDSDGLQAVPHSLTSDWRPFHCSPNNSAYELSSDSTIFMDANVSSRHPNAYLPTTTGATSSLEVKRSSYVPIAPYPKVTGMSSRRPTPIEASIANTLHLCQPRPLRSSSWTCLDDVPFEAQPKKSLSHGMKDLVLQQSIESSLNAHTPTTGSPFTASPLPEPTAAPSRPHAVASITEDPLMLLHYLTQVDLSKFGYSSPRVKVQKSTSEGDIFSRVPSVDQFEQIEDDFMEAVRNRKNKSRHHRVPSSSPDISSSSVLTSVTPRKARTESFPKSLQATSPTLKSSSPSPVPRSPSTPRVPYKGRFGTHPVCGACKTSKTPYWRDSWSDAFILCNACGLRYSKFKRYCNACSYVPRKEDKGAICCTQCSSPWSYKAT